MALFVELGVVVVVDDDDVVVGFGVVVVVLLAGVVVTGVVVTGVVVLVDVDGVVVVTGAVVLVDGDGVVVVALDPVFVLPAGRPAATGVLVAVFPVVVSAEPSVSGTERLWKLRTAANPVAVAPSTHGARLTASFLATVRWAAQKPNASR